MFIIQYVKNQIIMTTKDKELIERANKLHWSEWDKINEDEAETPEAKEILHRIMMTLYHREEYSVNGEC